MQTFVGQAEYPQVTVTLPMMQAASVLLPECLDAKIGKILQISLCTPHCRCPRQAEVQDRLPISTVRALIENVQ